MNAADQSALFLVSEAMSYTYAAALRAAAVLGVADHLADDARDADTLAEATGCDAAGLRRVLRLLVARGIVSPDGPDRFRLTAAGSALRRDVPGSVREAILMLTDDMFWRTSHVVGDTLRTRSPSFEAVFGSTVDDYFGSDPAKAALFYAGMEAVSAAENRLIARACELPGSGTVADIGGRYGGFLHAVLDANPSLRGILFDRPDEVVKHQPLRGRVEVVAGDFFESVPPADVYLLKRIIHNWDDDQSVRILSTCRRSLRPGGRVLVIDAFVPPGDEPHDSKAMDFMMLGALSGRERTAAELEPLVTRAGLRLSHVVPTGTPLSVAVTEATE
ncbi:methyltransferase [Amycolatopsis sp. AA4]|uniref:methyltransferase n=1 Tax=Actinomycetes TaxID=1760 RepID=UPI0001B54AEF|nr:MULTISPECIES: methyltransferase [Actinomycetes]ATY16425.1 methyltransferase [Amycolatopsis sp. AA4]